MKYPMTDETKKKFKEFMSYVDRHGEKSLSHAIQSFIVDGEHDLEERRKRALYISSMGSSISAYAFYALEEASRAYPEGQTEQIFELKRMKSLNKELNELTSKDSYETMTNQSAMRKAFTALIDFTNNAMMDMETVGKTRQEYRQEVRKVQAEFNELMTELMLVERTDPRFNEINERLMILDDKIDDMEGAWRRMKRT